MNEASPLGNASERHEETTNTSSRESCGGSLRLQQTVSKWKKVKGKKVFGFYIKAPPDPSMCIHQNLFFNTLNYELRLIRHPSCHGFTHPPFSSRDPNLV